MKMLNSVLLEGVVADMPEQNGTFQLEARNEEDVNTFEIRAYGNQAAQLSKGQTCRIVGWARQTAEEAWFVAEVIELKKE